MEINLISTVRGFFSPQPNRTPADAADSSANSAMLSMTAWPGRRVQHQVHLIEKHQDRATVWCPQYVGVGKSVWIEEGAHAVKCSVKAYVAIGDGYRLKLSVSHESRRSRERQPCNTPGDLEWVDGLTRIRCPVRITNLTPYGAQVMLSRPAPEIRTVRLQFADQTEAGTIRYCVRIGTNYLVGIEFA